MAASTEESPAPATATNTTMSTEVTETVKEVITAPAPTPVSEPETVKSKEEETKGDNGPVAESSPSMEPQGASFKEDSYFISELKESEKKALQELKLRVEEALKNNEFTEPPPKEPETKEAEAAEAKEGTKEESKEGGKETETKGEEDAKTPETKVEEVKGTVEEVKIVETISEIDCKVGEEEVKKEETVVTVTEKIEVPAQGDVPKHEETVVVSETVTESVVDSVPLAETTAVEAAETPVEVTVTKETVEVELQPVEDIYLWGVPLLHTHGDERTDVILLKFLRARDFKVSEAFTMLKNTILWRKRFGTDSILEEDFGTEYDGVAYMHGYDKEGHPVCYNVYGVFQDKETYQKSFGDAEKCDRFLRWRVQLLEKGIQQLSFKPGGVNSMVQITDLKNSPGPAKKNLRQATQKALDIFQDNYPELVARKIFVNVPWWYAVLSAMISPFLTQRTKSKFVVARPARVTETLFKYISPEYVPVQYGGLSRENDPEFSAADGGVSELFIKPAAKQIIEIPVTEAGASLVWDIIVVGWEVTYSEEFVPNAEGGYTVIIQKAKKMAIDQEPVRNSFKISEAGKVILTINNTSSKKKRIVYRTKVKNDLQQTA